MFQPIRVAVCGRKNAPPLFETLEVLGRETCLKRIEQAIQMLPVVNPSRMKEIMNPQPNEADTGAETPAEAGPSNFIREIILDDLKTNKYGGRVHTRFPPEPNGYLHIGHAKSIHLNFGLARSSAANAICGSTIPTRPRKRPSTSIRSSKTCSWLGGDWEDRLFYASDYFGQLYEWAVQLIKAGKAYVCDLTPDEVRKQRGTLTEPGQESPYRGRSVDENLDLFARMKAGEFPDGARTLRAKIDMASPNLNLRDPIMYRILHAEHHRTGKQWCIYPMYDFAHGESDSIEGITHSDLHAGI